jgi:hypothetical protein
MANLAGSYLGGTTDAFASSGFLPPTRAGALCDGTTDTFGSAVKTHLVPWDGREIPLVFFSSTHERGAMWNGNLLVFEAPVVPDVSPPAIANMNPPAGSTIGRTTKIAFDVTDNDLLRRVLVVASYAATGRAELVHDGTSFRAPFATLSARSGVAGGYHYLVGRSGGWANPPTIEIFAFDVSGNEA